MIRLSALPSFVERPIRFKVKEDFMATNASVAVRDSNIFAIVSAMDHFVRPDGIFQSLPTGWPDKGTDAKNVQYFLRLRSDLSVADARLIYIPPGAMPRPTGDSFRGFRGFESSRLFVWRNQLWATLCVSGCGLDPEAHFYIAHIQEHPRVPRFINIERLTTFVPTRREKNWMPEVSGDYASLRFHYRPGTLVDRAGRLMPTGVTLFEHLNGGSQVIPYRGGGLSVVHTYAPEGRTRSIEHFLLTDSTGKPMRISDEFEIIGPGLAVVTGIAYHPDGEHLILSYGRADGALDSPFSAQEQPFVATVKLTELGDVL